MVRSSTVAALLLWSSVAFASSDIGVQIAAPKLAAIGDNVTFAISAGNTGPDSASGVALTFSPPLSCGFVRIDSKSPNVTCTAPSSGSNADVNCTVSTFSKGTSAFVNFVYKVPSSVSPGATLTSAAAAFNVDDPNPFNNMVEATSTAEVRPDVRASVSFPGGYTPGTDLRYTMSVRNYSGTSATNFQLRSRADLAGAGVHPKTIVQTAGPAIPCSTDAAQQITCGGAPLPGGVQAAYTVILSPPASAAVNVHNVADVLLTDFSWSSADIESTVTRIEIADLAPTSSAPAAAKIGDDLAFKVVLKNLGPSDAQSTTTTWSAPPGTNFVRVEQPSQANCTTTQAGAVTCTAAAPVDTAATFVFHAKVSAAGSIVNSAAVSCASDPDTSNNATSATTTVIDPSKCDLSVSMTGDPYALAGQPFNVQLTFANAGPATAQNVTGAITLPAGVTLDATTSQCVASCSAGDLAAGMSAKKTLVVTAANSGDASITATGTTTTPDADSSNDSWVLTIHVYPALADLAITIPPLPSSIVAAGSDLLFTPLVVNHGPAPARPTLLFDLPDGSALLSGDGCTTFGGVTVACTSGDLLSGNAAQFTIHLRAPSATGHYAVTFLASSNVSDSKPADNEATAAFTVVDHPRRRAANH